ncbi:MAG: hypothetical protein J6T88_01015 [Bacteroidales bacterium]|nr:hypothetical protein [Bacteroidales bacterium]
MKEKYLKPTLTIVSFKVENGFAGTSPDPVSCFDLFDLDNDEDYNQASSYTERYWSW